MNSWEDEIDWDNLGLKENPHVPARGLLDDICEFLLVFLFMGAL